MARTIDDILNEADEIINSKGTEKTAAPAPTEDDVTSLARLLMDPAQVTKLAAQPESFEMNLHEKVAHAIAIVDTLGQIEELQKLAQLEAAALERGVPQEQIDAFIQEKLAANAATKFVVPAALTGVAGYAMGRKSGKEKGYNKAVDDFSQMLSQGE